MRGGGVPIVLPDMAPTAKRGFPLSRAVMKKIASGARRKTFNSKKRDLRKRKYKRKKKRKRRDGREEEKK
jgi:hypothetical protein